MKVVDNREARVVYAEDLQLIPGKNLLDTPEKIRLWDHAKKNDVVGHMLREKKLVEEGSAAEDDEAEAVELVQGTNDVAVLETLREKESRPAVLKAIDAKLEKLGPTPEQKKALADAEAKNAGNRKEAAKAAAGARAKPANVPEE